MKKILLCTLVMLTAFYSNAQFGYLGPLGSFFDRSSVLLPNSDYTQLVDTGIYKLNDSIEMGIVYNETSFYGRKVNDSVYYGCTFSNITDSALTEFNKNKAAYPGIGAENSNNYGVIHGTEYGADIDLYIGVRGRNPSLIYGFYITNAAITASSMIHGDSTAKKFGGPDGTDPDWLMLTVYKYYLGNLVDSTNIYLADFRSTDSTLDYILKDWKYVTLNPAPGDSLSFRLSSSDVDSLGNMRTPPYFCIDNLYIHAVNATQNPDRILKDVTIYPNPTYGFINIKSNVVLNATLYTIDGKQILYKQRAKQIDISNEPAGVYILKVKDEEDNVIACYPIIKR